MNVLNTEWTAILYLIAAVCFILALKGLGSPKTARRGNLIGAFGALLAMVVVFLSMELDNIGLILIVIAVGAIISVPASRAVKMTQMPQLVALFNGVGGGAAGLVALLELAHSDNLAAFIAVAFTVLVGGIAFSGSVITFLKLQELMPTRPIVFPGQALVIGLFVLLGLACAVIIVVDEATLAGWGLEGMKGTAAIGGLVIGLVLGLLLVLPVGGADVPIVISLLNAGTGLAVAASGLVLNNTLLLVAGTLVGASGSILTAEMAKAMGRSVTGILFGAFKGGSTAGSTTMSDRPVKSGSPDDVAILLGYAQRVIVVPGYGLAVAQAQHTMAELAETLEAKGIEVVFGIHPVAGRMPGHMNVLLAEANVSYDVLQEMDEVNPKFKTTDVVLVVGANDVVNPAAKTSPGSPIYGMPILEVSTAKQVVFLKRSMRPGFAGIENELLFEPTTTLLFGDAKESLAKVLGAVKAL